MYVGQRVVVGELRQPALAYAVDGCLSFLLDIRVEGHSEEERL